MPSVITMHSALEPVRTAFERLSASGQLLLLCAAAQTSRGNSRLTLAVNSWSGISLCIRRARMAEIRKYPGLIALRAQTPGSADRGSSSKAADAGVGMAALKARSDWLWNSLPWKENGCVTPKAVRR